MAALKPLEKTSVEWIETLDDRGYKISDWRDPNNPIDRFYPSVSTILQNVQSGFGFGAWKEEQAAQLGVEGARLDALVRMKLGTNVHKLIERYLRGEEVSWTKDGTASSPKLWDDREWKAFMRWIRWFQSEPTEVLAAEFTVFSHKYGYAGTLDAVLKRSDGICIYDWKHSQSISASYLRQIAAYRSAVQEMFPDVPIAGGSVVALNTKTKAGVTEKHLDAEESDYHFKRFLNIKRVFDDENQEFKPSTVSLPAKVIPTHATDNIFINLSPINKEITE